MLKFFKWVAIGLITLIGTALLAVVVWPEKAYEPFEVSEGFRAEALAYPLPALPSDWQDHSLTAADGTDIYWGQTANRETAKASLIFVPGFKSSLMMKGDEFEMLYARDYHIVGIDLRGQGRSQRHRAEHPEKLYAEDFSVYADDLRMVIEAADLPKGKPVILMGTSFGAAVATRAVGEFDLSVDGLMPMVPAYRPQTPPYTYEQAQRLTRILKMLGKSKDFSPGQGVWQPYTKDLTQPSICASNPQRLYLTEALYIRHPEQRVGGATVNWIAELMENGEIVTAPDYAAKIDIPVSMILASNDAFVVNELAQTACESGFPNCKVTIIPNTGHCITMENDDVLGAIYDETDALVARIQN